MKKLLATTAIGTILATGTAMSLYRPAPLSDTYEDTEIIKVIHQSDGLVNIVNSDGLGILLKPEDLAIWCEPRVEPTKWENEMKDAICQANESDKQLKNTKTIEARYAKAVTTQSI